MAIDWTRLVTPGSNMRKTRTVIKTKTTYTKTTIVGSVTVKTTVVVLKG